MHQKLLKSAHYIELGSYQYWPVLVPRGIRLYTYEQIPVSLKDNPYITDGYRAYLPSRLCIKRTAKLPRIKPPNMAYPCSSDVILVASVNSVCHAVQT
ncbi:Progestin and adipoQ receptor member 3 [Saguinus oedipus]|uniref:Progestin and adipoQ receptor member 3 n=1 Tax=Saguinus oedipus TaxID=9490 RepID=A0ABQ9W2N3_SAGOE|nr:Progestin and adipoQ receptor member 3 [Saguinus oedipus]